LIAYRGKVNEMNSGEEEIELVALPISGSSYWRQRTSAIHVALHKHVQDFTSCEINVPQTQSAREFLAAPLCWGHGRRTSHGRVGYCPGIAAYVGGFRMR
jgi:hypothetical protein